MNNLIFSSLLFLFVINTLHAQVGINNDNSTPNASAMLDVKSTAKGFLAPRMTTAQRNGIASPAEGLLVYDTDLGAFYYYHSSVWMTFGGSLSGWQIIGNAGTNPAVNFIGTTDDKHLAFRVNNLPAGKIEAGPGYNTSFGNGTLVNNAGNLNSALGADALNLNSTGFENTSIGAGALQLNTIGVYNSAIGTFALSSNVDGSQNTATGRGALFSNTGGSFNTANGLGAMLNNSLGNNNTAVGRGAMAMNTTGSSNVALGCRALVNNTVRNNLVAVGDSALFNNGTGATQVYHGTSNTAVGSKTLFSNTTGSSNSAIGFKALFSNATGYGNEAFGMESMKNNTSGFWNVGCGSFALSSNTQGSENTAVGSSALLLNLTGSRNVAVGPQSLLNNHANDNISLGYFSSYFTTYGYSNIAIGTRSLFKNSSGSNLVAIGDSSLFHNGEYANVSQGESVRNTAIGSKTQFSNKKGSDNTAVGYTSMYYNNNGSRNTALGSEAMYNANNGSNNVALGFQSLYTNLDGSENIAIGYKAMYKNAYATHYNIAIGDSSLFWYTGLGSGSSSANNVAVGSKSTYNTIGGIDNTAIGSHSLFQNTTGTRNVAVGSYALYGSNNSYLTGIGYNAGGSTNNQSVFCTFVGALTKPNGDLVNSTVLGYGAQVNYSNQIIIGNSSVNYIGGFASWSNYSDGRFKTNVKENVPGMAFIKLLRPITYNLDVSSLNTELYGKSAKNPSQSGLQIDFEKELRQGVSEKEKMRYTGFIAQEVENAAKQCGFDFSGVDVPKDEKGYYSLRYAEFVVPLVKAVQEQQEVIENQQKQIDELKRLVDELVQKFK